MFKTLFIVAAIIASTVSLVRPVSAGVAEDVAALMEKVRKQEVVDNAELRLAPPADLLEQLRLYLSDPDSRVRLEVLGQTIGVAQRHASDPKIRRMVTGFLVSVAKTDSTPSIAGYAASSAYAFKPYFVRADFTDEMRQDIKELVNQNHPRSEWVLLAGVADVQTAKERLRQLAAQGERTAALALARMGDPAALEGIQEKYMQAPNAIQMWRDMAYIRQPAAVDVLVRALFNEEKLPSEDPKLYPGSPYAAYALDLLAQIIEDFPIKSVGPSYSDAEIEQARAWITAHRNDLKIRR